MCFFFFFFFSSRRRHTRFDCDWSSDVCSSDLLVVEEHTLLAEAFFMRKPEENEGGTYRFLLERNARTYGVHFSVDALGDVFRSEERRVGKECRSRWSPYH